jgi:proteasome accessory factor B
VRLEGDDPDDALLKVGAAGADGPALVALPADPRLPGLYEAVRARRLLRFAYDGVDRRFEPYGLLCRDAFWYLVGHDRTRDAPRTFRVDRISGAIDQGEPDAFTVPPTHDPEKALPVQPYSLAPGEATEALVEADLVVASRVVREVGEEAVRERREDGSVVVAIPVQNPEGLRSWLFGFLDHARVLEPPEVVAVVTGWLSAMAGDEA